MAPTNPLEKQSDEKLHQMLDKAFGVRTNHRAHHRRANRGANYRTFDGAPKSALGGALFARWNHFVRVFGHVSVFVPLAGEENSVTG